MRHVAKDFVRIDGQDYWVTDQEAWEAGLGLVLQLRALRGPTMRSQPETSKAEALIREYCMRLRRTPPFVALARAQRKGRLTHEGVVAVLYAMASYWGLFAHYRETPIEVAVLACGYEPRKLRRFMAEIERGRGIGRYVVLADGRLQPTRYLMDLLEPRFSLSQMIEYVRRFPEIAKDQVANPEPTSSLLPHDIELDIGPEDAP